MNQLETDHLVLCDAIERNDQDLFDTTFNQLFQDKKRLKPEMSCGDCVSEWMDETVSPILDTLNPNFYSMVQQWLIDHATPEECTFVLKSLAQLGTDILLHIDNITVLQKSDFSTILTVAEDDTLYGYIDLFSGLANKKDISLFEYALQQPIFPHLMRRMLPHENGSSLHFDTVFCVDDFFHAVHNGHQPEHTKEFVFQTVVDHYNKLTLFLYLSHCDAKHFLKVLQHPQFPNWNATDRIIEKILDTHFINTFLTQQIPVLREKFPEYNQQIFRYSFNQELLHDNAKNICTLLSSFSFSVAEYVAAVRNALDCCQELRWDHTPLRDPLVKQNILDQLVSSLTPEHIAEWERTPWTKQKHTEKFFKRVVSEHPIFVQNRLLQALDEQPQTHTPIKRKI